MTKIELLKQLSNETRLRLVALLIEHQLCVCELEEILKLRQVNISKHLIKLKEAGVVDVRRDKQRGFYHLTVTFLQETDLVKYVKNMIVTEAVLIEDYEAFLEHESVKDQNIYVCNMFKKETLT